MKKHILIALSAIMVFAMASCSKEDVNPTNGNNTVSLSENALKANESNNFANTQWVSIVDTTFDITYDAFDSTAIYSIPVEITFTYDFNATGDTALLSITFDSSDVIFVTIDGESLTIPFAFNYDTTTHTGSMDGSFASIDGMGNTDVSLDFVYDATDNTMLFTLPIESDPYDPLSGFVVSLLQELTFSLVQ